jgi:hypothetical protein
MRTAEFPAGNIHGQDAAPSALRHPGRSSREKSSLAPADEVRAALLSLRVKARPLSLSQDGSNVMMAHFCLLKEEGHFAESESARCDNFCRKS